MDAEHLLQIADIEHARTLIAHFPATPADDRRAFAIHVPMKARPNP